MNENNSLINEYEYLKSQRELHNIIWNNLRLNNEYFKQLKNKNKRIINNKISKVNNILYDKFYLFSFINLTKLPNYIRQIILNYFHLDLKNTYSIKLKETDEEIRLLFKIHQLTYY